MDEQRNKEIAEALGVINSNLDRGASRQTGRTWKVVFNVIEDVDRLCAKTGRLVNEVLFECHNKCMFGIVIDRLEALTRVRGGRFSRAVSKSVAHITWPDGRGVIVYIRTKERGMFRGHNFAETYADHYSG